MGRRKGHGVFGPYRHGNRWQLVIRGDGDRPARPSYATEEEAERIANGLRKRFNVDARTVTDAIEAYKQHLVAKGNKERSRDATEYRLGVFFKTVMAQPLVDLTPARAGRLYEDLVGRFSVDSQRNALAEAKTFLGWCVSRRWITRNPLEQVKGTGKRKHGKEQLRIDEARKWIEVAAGLAKKEPGAVAALCTVLLGVRASEIVSRVVRDLDDGGRLLWIPSAKTEAGRRTLEIPELLQLHLVELSKGRGPLEPLFGAHDRGWPRKWVQKICDLAKVPKVTAHGMRGLHSTLAVERGITAHVVAGALGHASFSTTAESYVAPGTVEKSKAKAALQVLIGGKR